MKTKHTSLRAIIHFRCMLALAVIIAFTSHAHAEVKDGSVYKGTVFNVDPKTGEGVINGKKFQKEDFMVTLKNGNRFLLVDGFPFINGTEEDFPPEQVFEALQKIGWSFVEKAKEVGFNYAGHFYYLRRQQSIDWFAKYYPKYVAPEPLPVTPGKLRNLSEKPTQPRFLLTDKVWPAKPGDASVCLWEDDKMAAFDFNQDDNNATDQDGFREVAKKYGVKATFNLITYNIGSGYEAASAPGTWETWKKAQAEGFHIASHTYMHYQDWLKIDGWPGLDFEAAESKRMLDQHLGQNTKVLVYPGGGTPQMQYKYRYLLPTSHEVNMLRTSAVKYYAAARGASNGDPINQANMIDYFSLSTSQLPLMSWDYDSLLDPKPGNKHYRGWLNIFTHGLLLERWDSDPQWKGYRKVFEWVDKHREDILIGFMDDIALYGEERDTATLKTTSADDSKIVLNLASQMEPTIFDYPLTVKVRLADSWKNVKATQAGKSVDAKIIMHENAKFALVKAKPDCGEIILKP